MEIIKEIVGNSLVNRLDSEITGNQEVVLENYLQKIKKLEEEKKQLESELFNYKQTHGDISKSLDEFLALQKLLEIINSTLDANVISKSLLKLIDQVVPVQEGAVFITMDHVTRAFPDSVEKSMWEVFNSLEEDGVLNWLFEKKGSIILPVEDLMISNLPKWEGKNMLLIPLIGFNEGLGAVVAVTEKHEESFAYKDFELINMLGFQAATAFHHARTFNKLHEAHGEVKKSQNSLVSTVRMAAVGELSGGIAHEINNPLQIILGHIQLFQLRGEQNESITVIAEQATRISNIVRGLLNFVRQDYSDINNEYVVPAQIIQKTFELIRGQFNKHSIKVDFSEMKETSPVKINSNYLQQIFLNLLLNAKSNLLTNGGELKVETEDVDDYIIVKVIDNGLPMDNDFVRRVQEPFQNRSVGTEPLQLGFAVSIQMIKDINGLVQINASKGVGNEITIHFPKTTQNTKEAVDVF